MPVPIKAWACKWKCGRRVATVKKRMEEHEDRCYRNPKNRTCMTCDLEDCDEHGWYCVDWHRQSGRKAVYNCEHWKEKVRSDET